MATEVPFSYTVRAISDFGKSPLQVASEYQQELAFFAQYLPGSISYAGPLHQPVGYSDYAKFLLEITRRYSTHEQIMESKNPMLLVPEGKVLTFKETLGPVFHVIAGVIAYVPGFGTAVAFVLNAATSLAEGAPITDATLDAVKGALPGQPASTMAFDATVAIARGEPIENVGIAALPIDETSKEYLKQAAHVIRGLAEGQPVTAVALDAIYEQLPPDGQRAMELAHRAMNGEAIGDLALEEAARAAKSAGEQTANQFMAQVGYQELMDRVPDDIRNAMEAAKALTEAAKMQAGQSLQTRPVSPPVALGRVERVSDKQRNDTFVASAVILAKNNPRIRVHRAGPPPYVKDIAAWQRGFDVGIGAAQGVTANTSELDRIQTSLGTIPAMSGFNDAKKLQFEITASKLQSILKGIEMSLALGRMISPQDRAKMVQAASDGVTMAQNNPQILAARNLNPDPRYKWGFDVATGLTVGTSEGGPGQAAMRYKLGPISPGGGPNATVEPGSNVALQGFDVGQALQHGITKSLAAGAVVGGNATVAAGNLVTQGLAGSSQSADQKAATMGVVASNPLARQGAQEAIAKVAEGQKGIFTRILEFFGLA